MRYWCRFSRTIGSKLVAGKQEGDQLWTGDDREGVALVFWHHNRRNHKLPVVISVIAEDGSTHSEVEVALVVVANERTRLIVLCG